MARSTCICFSHVAALVSLIVVAIYVERLAIADGNVPSSSTERYLPNWESLSKREIPAWFDDAKFGIFIHWGVFSVPSYSSEWFWHEADALRVPNVLKFLQDNELPAFSYPEFASGFRAEMFDAEEWAAILKSSGARYVVLTSKHHEGFTMWPSKWSWNWNAVDVGPKKDLLGELSRAVKGTGLKFGVYYSLFEWFNPLYLEDKRNNFSTQFYIKAKAIPEMYSLVNEYSPDVFWADGDWEADTEYWNSTHFLAWLYNDSPMRDVVVTNDRWGKLDRCKNGDFLTCDDRFKPDGLMRKKWENCLTIDRKSWGFRREASLEDYLTTEQLIAELVQTVSLGGNMLLNVGPTHYGKIPVVYEQRLREIGKWLAVNGPAIYGTKPWKWAQQDVSPNTKDEAQTSVWYTQSKDGEAIFAVFLKWPENSKLKLRSVTPDRAKFESVTLLGFGKVRHSMIINSREDRGIQIDLSDVSVDKLPCLWAWALKLH